MRAWLAYLRTLRARNWLEIAIGLLCLFALVSSAFAETQLVWSPSGTNRDNGTWQCAADATPVLTGSTYDTSTIRTFGELAATANVYQCRADRPLGSGAGCPVAGDFSQEGMQPKSVARLCAVPEPPPPPPPPSEFTLTRPGCYLTRLDVRWIIQESGPDALVWWCDRPGGIKKSWRTGETSQGFVGKIISAVVGGDDASLFELDRQVTDRLSSEDELLLVNRVEMRYGPRCFTRTTGTATSVPVYGRNTDGTRGARRVGTDGSQLSIAPDVPVACRWRLTVTTPTDNNRYCYVQLLTATNGQQIPMDSWGLCRWQKAPAEGWPP